MEPVLARIEIEAGLPNRRIRGSRRLTGVTPWALAGGAAATFSG